MLVNMLTFGVFGRQTLVFALTESLTTWLDTLLFALTSNDFYFVRTTYAIDSTDRDVWWLYDIYK